MVSLGEGLHVCARGGPWASSHSGRGSWASCIQFPLPCVCPEVHWRGFTRQLELWGQGVQLLWWPGRQVRSPLAGVTPLGCLSPGAWLRPRTPAQCVAQQDLSPAGFRVG